MSASQVLIKRVYHHVQPHKDFEGILQNQMVASQFLFTFLPPKHKLSGRRVRSGKNSWTFFFPALERLLSKVLHTQPQTLPQNTGHTPKDLEVTFPEDWTVPNILFDPSPWKGLRHWAPRSDLSQADPRGCLDTKDGLCRRMSSDLINPAQSR